MFENVLFYHGIPKKLFRFIINADNKKSELNPVPFFSLRFFPYKIIL